MKIAYLGPEGSFCHMALLEYFGNHEELVPAKTIPETIALLEQGQVACAVVPIENSSYGVVNETLDSLTHAKVQAIGEVILPIQHHLWGLETSAQTETIYGHAQALAQCQKYIRSHYPDAEEIAVHSTAFGAKKVRDEGKGLAIGSALAGALYDLHCIAPNIQDMAQNQTRFMVLGHQTKPPTGQDKTSFLALNIPNIPGALLKLLEPFARHQVNISLPSLRPIPDSPWHYVFYFDLDGHLEDPAVQHALTELQEFTTIKILGSYGVSK